MYAADLPENAPGQFVTLSVSGKLWQSSLVMRDLETNSLWSHLLGRAMEGPLKGTVLQPLVSDMTTWAEWKTLHPNTTVLNMARTHRGYTGPSLRLASPFVLGFRTDQGNWSIPFPTIAKQMPLNLTAAGEPLVAVWNSDTGAARLFSRRLAGKTLTFAAMENNGEQVTDSGTQSVWNAASGRAVSGSLKGQSLTPWISIVSLKGAWFAFHPNSRDVEIP